jgi:ribosomal protein S18 acetylase RimI-like enzyme
MRSEVVRCGHERLRIGPWRGDHRVAFIAPVGDAAAPSATMVRAACDVLETKGYEQVLTGALAERERRGFVDAGFEVHEHLHLLAHDLDDIGEAPTVRMRRAWPTDRARALAVDATAFPAFWRLDRDGLVEAIRATPVARFRVGTEGRIVAYAVTGRAGPRGYIQRLAVHPDHAGRGFGTALVVDGLRWLRAHHARQAVVNTQAGNDRALSLYERLGFRRQPSGLLVLARPLGDRLPTP